MITTPEGYSHAWTQLADMPGNPNSVTDSRIGATSFTIGNKIYMGTGLQLALNQVPKKDIFEYNISTNSWVQKQPIPVQRAFAISFAINGKGYIGSGNIASQQGSPSNEVEVLSDFYEYNPTTDSWVSRQNIEPSGRWGAVGFTINGKGYIAFGSRGQLGGLTDSAIPLNSVREFDPQTDTWISKTSAQEGFIFAQVFVLNNKAYITGGLRINPAQLIRESVTNTNEYNPANDTWVAKANLPTIINSTNRLTNNSRASAISFGLLDGGYLVSGQIWNNTAGSGSGGGFVCSAGLGAFVDGDCLHKNILRYNPHLNIWTEVSNSNPFDPTQGIELAAFSQDDCGFGYATAGRISTGANFKQFKFSDAPDGDYIQGPSIVCSTANSTFTLQLSAPGTVTWTKSSNVTIVSGQGTKNLVVKATTNTMGTGWVQASINLGCRVVSFPQKTFRLGKPDFATPISGPSELLVGSSGNYTIASALGATGSYTWTVQSNWEMYSSGPIANGSAAIIVANSTGYKTITVSTINACGSSSTQKVVNGVTSCTTIMSVSPNPTKGDIVVNVAPPPGGCGGEMLTLQADTSVNTIDVLDSNGTKVYSSVFTGEVIELKGLGLKNGVYFVKVLYNGTALEKRVIVN